MTSTFSPTLVHEFTLGMSHRDQSETPEDPSAATYSGIGLSFRPPYEYSSNQFIGVSFSGTPNQSFGSMSFGPFPFQYSNTTLDLSDNVSKVWSRHLRKAGVYLQRSNLDQMTGPSMTFNFANHALNPSNSGHPFANALLGNFETLSEPNRPHFLGSIRYTNVEWYVQDTWRLGRGLTLDYGIRFYWIPPVYHQGHQGRGDDQGREDDLQEVAVTCEPPTPAPGLAPGDHPDWETRSSERGSMRSSAAVLT